MNGVISEKCVQRERTSALHQRLVRADGEIQKLKIEIYNQRASWDMRFLELQKRQHDLREQLTSEILGRSAALHRDAVSEEACEVFTESGLENGLSEEQRHTCSGTEESSQCLQCLSLTSRREQTFHTSTGGVKHTQNAPDIGMLREDSLCGGQASWPSVMDTRSWRSGGRPHRVFVPHSPLDLRIGHRVRIILPSGRISTGTLRYLGRVSNWSDCHLGVELEEAENGQHDGTCEGQRYFDWFESCLYHSAHKCNQAGQHLVMSSDIVEKEQHQRPDSQKSSQD
ncbi:hypothetical protein E1301_Tti022610 [Triplophysa tibetana]|uniref:CAP-Gly domain-containing protein n=1 Tax=Triplophysa tibetana TaxID=1572043 RepID=A0A5A9N362_9TELE|nr:hypothetical protein E1301_Tti022610 [Triplophysa tibetana]